MRAVPCSPSTRFPIRPSDMADRDGVAALFAEHRFPMWSISPPRPACAIRSAAHAYMDANLDGFPTSSRAVATTAAGICCTPLHRRSMAPIPDCRFRVSDNVDHPLSLYGATKKANELMAHAYAHLFAIPATGLRFFTVYGPWGRPDMAMWLFTAAIMQGSPVRLFNHGRMRRDFTHVDDITEAVVRLVIGRLNPIRHGLATSPILRPAGRPGMFTTSATVSRWSCWRSLRRSSRPSVGRQFANCCRCSPATSWRPVRIAPIWKTLSAFGRTLPSRTGSGSLSTGIVIFTPAERVTPDN